MTLQEIHDQDRHGLSRLMQAVSSRPSREFTEPVFIDKDCREREKRSREEERERERERERETTGYAGPHTRRKNDFGPRINLALHLIAAKFLSDRYIGRRVFAEKYALSREFLNGKLHFVYITPH